MHLGDGALTVECAMTTWGVAGVGLAACAAGAGRSMLADRPAAAKRLATAGALGLGVFAAQMINVPVLPWASGHLVGGVLLAWLCGPAIGGLTLAAVLAVQALLLGDGGVMALGANILNMALLPALAFALVRAQLGTRKLAAPASYGVIAGLSLLTILGAAALIVGEVALGRSADQLAPLGGFAGRMLGAHAVIGLFEAVLTVAIIAALTRRPFPLARPLAMPRLATVAAAGVVLIALAGLISSGMPDGYEASAELAEMAWLLH